MSSQEKSKRPIKFELWVRVECHHCLLASGGKKSIKVQVPARGLPNQVRCFNCGGMIPTKNLFKEGKEIVHLESNEQIKGVD